MDTIVMPRARYRTIVDRFAAAIRSGELSPGTQLPTHRALARQEHIALVTASRVYQALEMMGLVSGEAGRGTFVRETALPISHGIDQPHVTEGMLDLNFNSPSLDRQAELLRHALRQLSTSGDLESLLHYQPHAGRLHERTLIATHLKTRGLSVNAEQVVIVSGAQHGLATAVMGLLKPGDLIAVDALIYPGFKAIAEIYQLEMVPIPLARCGPDFDALAVLCQQHPIRAVYAMPTLHNPMGWVLSQSQREQLVSIAQHHDLVIVEDAAYAFHAENPPPPLTDLAPERTVYISGFSKSVATGLRVGFVISPVDWVPRMERAIRATTWNTPRLMTTLSCRWIEDGTVARLEEEKRQDAQSRQSIARKIFQNWPYISHANAYFLWLPLPEEVRADQVATELLKMNIAVSTAEPFATTDHIPHALRIALGSVALEALEPALNSIKDIIETHAYGLRS